LDPKRQKTKWLVESILNFNNITTGSITADEKNLVRDIFEEFLKREDKIDHYENLLNGLVEQGGPRNDDVLHFYIMAFLGFNIPRKKKCRNHVAPFTFISDVYFERVSNAVGFANRGGGKTLSVAIINHLNCTFKQGCQTVSAGSTIEQAGNMYTHFLGFHDRNDFVNDLVEGVPTKSHTKYKNSSTLKIITGSKKGFNGPHPPKCCLDEIDLMDWDIYQQGLSMPQSLTLGSQIIPAQIIQTSTRKYSTGTFQRVLDKVKEDTRKVGKSKIYCWCIWEDLEKCTRKCKNDPLYGDCPELVREICSGRAHNCDGWMSVSDFINAVLNLDRDVLDSEWFCKKPSQEILVYGNYWRPDVHVISEETKGMSIEKYKEMRFTNRDIIVMGVIDFGSTVAHHFVFQQYYIDVTDFKKHVQEKSPDDWLRRKLKFFLFYEYRSSGDSLDNHAARIKSAPGWHPNEIIFADPSAKQAKTDLIEVYGIPTRDAINDVESGIDLVKSHLTVEKSNKRTHFYIFEDYLDCNDAGLMPTHKEFEVYRYSRLKDGKPNRKSPLPINDHGMDCVRYMIQSAIPFLKEYFQPMFEEIEEDEFGDAGYWDFGTEDYVDL